MEKIFYLDLHINELYGWEKYKGLDYVTQMIEGIKRGNNFPPVPVLRTNNGLFYLSFNTKIPDNIFLVDGGHNRAIAHYRARKPLKCMLLEGEPPLIHEKFFYVPIRDITVE
jgi:hypothetical protein